MKLFKIVFSPLVLIFQCLNMSVIYMPGNFGIKLRQILYRPFFKKYGKRVFVDVGVHFKGMKYISLASDIHIDKNCIIQAGKSKMGNLTILENNNYKGEIGEISIGNNVHIVQNCLIFGFGGVEIGNNCTLSASSKLYSQSNLPYDPNDRLKITSIMPYQTAHFIEGPVCLKENVWIGLNGIIMPGTTIHKNSFSVSFSLLKGEYTENSYLKGQPAKIIRQRFEQ